MGSEIRKRRHRLRLTQQALAEASGLSQSVVSRAELDQNVDAASRRVLDLTLAGLEARER